MVALPHYVLPAGDVIQRRIDQKREEKRLAAHHADRRVPIASYPLTAWLLRQEVLYRQQVTESQPVKPVSQPILNQSYTHVYHLRWGELPHNFIGNLAWKAVSFIGSFFDAWTAARA